MIIPFYLSYLFISIAITVWVGRTLHKNGRVFLVENFKGREALADSVNHLLLVGFYLINLGFICLTLKEAHRPVTPEDVIEVLATKEGFVILVLGAMHFFNMLVLTKYRDCSLFGGGRGGAPKKDDDPEFLMHK
jgi:hypothetical protein